MNQLTFEKIISNYSDRKKIYSFQYTYWGRKIEIYQKFFNKENDCIKNAINFIVQILDIENKKVDTAFLETTLKTNRRYNYDSHSFTIDIRDVE
jgi:hypothetical protein